MLEAQRRRRLAWDPARAARALRVLGTGAMPLLEPRLAQRAGHEVHLVAGELDEKFSSIARDAAPRIGARVHVIPNAGHNVVLEAPRALAALLAELGSRPSPSHETTTNRLERS
ncbi:MAG: hypothetical protein U0271_43145 [Polyangiaceae bacterium]